jgi:hypothetical protein
VREITRRNRGQRVQDVITELRLYVTGWMNYFGISHTYKVVLELDNWLRRRVRLYHWKQWKQPCMRRRNLLRLGANPSSGGGGDGDGDGAGDACARGRDGTRR